MTTDTDFRKIIAEAFKNADAKPIHERSEYLIRELLAVLLLKPDIDSFNTCVVGNFDIRLIINKNDWYAVSLRVTEFLVAMQTQVQTMTEELRSSE